MAGGVEQVAELLAPVREALQGDGYDLKVEGFSVGVLVLSVLAGPDVCEDCLVPKRILENRVLHTLSEAGLRGVRAVRVQYPSDA